MAKSKLDELTPKQRLFVVWFTTPGDTFFNGSQSARKAGYKGSDPQMAVVANQNIRKLNVQAAIREQTRKMYNAADITADRVLSDIEMVRMQAIMKGQYHTALRASELHGKYLKMFADRIEHVHSIDDVTTQDLVEMAQQLAEKVDGFSFPKSIGGNGAGEGSVSDTPGDQTTH